MTVYIAETEIQRSKTNIKFLQKFKDYFVKTAYNIVRR